MGATAVSIPGPLGRGRFLQRYNRFLLQVRLDDTGTAEAVHLPDPGRLRELLVPGARLWLRPSDSPARKTRWTAALVESPGSGELVSLDTTLPNRLISRALRDRALPELGDWRFVRSEVSMGRSRLDFLLSRAGGERMAMEVKSVSLVEDGVGLFPDAVTERGARHVRELAEIAGTRDWSASVLFVLQRNDGRRIKAARRIDPRFADALEEAVQAGVQVLGRRCEVGLNQVELGGPVPVSVG